MNKEYTSISIQSGQGPYTVFIEEDWAFLSKLCANENAWFIVDATVMELYGQNQLASIPQDKFMVLEALESNKTIDVALALCEKLMTLSAKRNLTLVSIGGGIIQDVTGFAASVLYRGIDWQLVPTTLLAACDSCIGSKTSLNFKQYKNLLGTFYPPHKIYIQPEFFNTLSRHDYLSGLGEVEKFNFMCGLEGLAGIERDIDALLARDSKTLKAYIESSLQAKKPYIEADEYDRGLRLNLNFAHTFGHALETVTRYAIPHGTAVAIGILMANDLSVQRGLLHRSVAERAQTQLLKIIDISPAALRFDDAAYVDAMRKDKKQTGNAIRVILLSEDMTRMVFDTVTQDDILRCLQFVRSLLCDNISLGRIENEKE